LSENLESFKNRSLLPLIMDKKTTMFVSGHPDDIPITAGIARECLKYHKVIVSNFSNGDSNVDLKGNPNLRTKETVNFLNQLSDLSELEQKLKLCTKRDSVNANVFTFNASENRFVEDFVYEQNPRRVSRLLKNYTGFIVNQLKQYHPDYVLVPHYDGSSQTHDFVHLVVREILMGLNSKAKLFSYPGYPIKEAPTSPKLKVLMRTYALGAIGPAVENAQMTDVYDKMCVGRFLKFDTLGLHNNDYKPINFKRGLQDGFYKIPEQEWRPIFLKALEAFESQDAFRGAHHHFLDRFKDPLYHEILRMNTKKDSFRYMWDGDHVYSGLATYYHHYMNKRQTELKADLSLTHFIYKMNPFLEQVREITQSKKDK
jgi:hypothetical protein